MSIRTAGTVTYDGKTYIMLVVFTKFITNYYLFSEYHEEDRNSLLFGGNLKHPVRNLLSYQLDVPSSSYLLATIRSKNIGNDIETYGLTDILLDIIERIYRGISYSFKLSDISIDTGIKTGPKMELIREFSAQDERLTLSYKKVNGFFQELRLVDKGLTLDLREMSIKYPSSNLFKLLYKPMTIKNRTSVRLPSAKSIDFETVVRGMEDSSWYFITDETTGKRKFLKDYRDVRTVEKFEELVIDELISEIIKARQNGTLPVIVGEDTETTGLEAYDIPQDVQDTVVAIPFSCKDHTARLIYTDMEYFSNVPISYVKERLEPFFSRNAEIEARLKTDSTYEEPTLTIRYSGGNFEFKRSEIFLVGHNVMFDIRTQKVHDFSVYFDADTLQMSFNLDPFLTKGRNSLEEITHYLLGAKTVSLIDVLGKGNADKFRYITDPEVAKIYGCADADFVRLIYKALRNIYQECESFHGVDLYQSYRNQDVSLMNHIALADFEGVRINREAFIKGGKAVLKDIEIISNFTYRYVGLLVAATNYKVKRDMAKQAGVDMSTFPPFNPDNVPLRKFKFAGNELITTLYDVLHYPIKAWTGEKNSKSDGSEKKTKPRPAINKRAMQLLMNDKIADDGFLASDITRDDGKTVLISAKKFNSSKWKVAYLVSLIGPRKKEYDAYFKPFVEGSYGHRLCKSTSFSRIDTRRISNPLQTIKGSLKRDILSHSDNYAMFDFDMSQVELRIMASLAGDEDTMLRMQHPESDSHVETAAAMNDIPKHLVTKEQRSGAKDVSFGYPYGLQIYSMCEKRFGDTSDYHLGLTAELISKFEEAKKVIVDFLNQVRDETVRPVEIPECLRHYLRIGDNIPVGMVRNLKGFYKLFQLDNMDEKKLGRVRRQAGNFPIQGFAAELFRIILMRFYITCVQKGWIANNWIKWHLLVHDELLGSFKRGDIHPVELAVAIYESCTVTIKGHTTYYIGINIGNNWGECKDDYSELPVIMVQRLAKRWKAGEFDGEVVLDPKSYMDNLRSEYIRDRIFEVFSEADSNMKNGVIDCSLVRKNVTNYTVRKYLLENYKPLWTPNVDRMGDIVDDDLFDSCLASWSIHYFETNVTILTSKKKRIVLDSNIRAKYEDIKDKKFEYTYSELFEGASIKEKYTLMTEDIDLETEDDIYYSSIDWDLNNSSSYFMDYSSHNHGSDSYEDLFEYKGVNAFEAMRKTPKTVNYKHLVLLGSRVYAKIPRTNLLRPINKTITNKNLFLESNKGITLFYQTPTGGTIKGGQIAPQDLELIDNIINKEASAYVI